jgi:hypothetical protein
MLVRALRATVTHSNGLIKDKFSKLALPRSHSTLWAMWTYIMARNAEAHRAHAERSTDFLDYILALSAEERTPAKEAEVNQLIQSGFEQAALMAQDASEAFLAMSIVTEFSTDGGEKCASGMLNLITERLASGDFVTPWAPAIEANRLVLENAPLKSCDAMLERRRLSRTKKATKKSQSNARANAKTRTRSKGRGFPPRDFSKPISQQQCKFYGECGQLRDGICAWYHTPAERQEAKGPGPNGTTDSKKKN